MKTAIHSQNLRPGFSLLEMLMTLAILGIMSNMALAWFGGDFSTVEQARDQRNAQTLCSLCQAVDAAGIHLAVEETTPMAILTRLAEGIVIKKGAFKGRTFQLPGLNETELKAASRYLLIRGGQMSYNATGKAIHGETPSGEEI